MCRLMLGAQAPSRPATAGLRCWREVARRPRRCQSAPAGRSGGTSPGAPAQSPSHRDTPALVRPDDRSLGLCSSSLPDLVQPTWSCSRALRDQAHCVDLLGPAKCGAWATGCVVLMQHACRAQSDGHVSRAAGQAPLEPVSRPSWCEAGPSCQQVPAACGAACLSASLLQASRQRQRWCTSHALLPCTPGTSQPCATSCQPCCASAAISVTWTGNKVSCSSVLRPPHAGGSTSPGRQHSPAIRRGQSGMRGGGSHSRASAHTAQLATALFCTGAQMLMLLCALAPEVNLLTRHINMHKDTVSHASRDPAVRSGGRSGLQSRIGAA